MTQATLLRSISLRDDLAVPARLAHYRPTRRSLPVTRAVLEGDATMVIAAYGSGKSLAAGIGALCIANDSGTYKTLKPVLGRLRRVDASLHAMVQQRRRSGRKGQIAVLTGYVRDVAASLAKATGLKDPPQALTEVLKRLERRRSDRLAIIWDEFGRHLEGLAAEGRARDLNALQQLAEWTARATKPQVSLVLLMHQSLLAYANGLNQTSRNEWRKVEGRFQHIRFVEDSQELYELIADVVQEGRAREPTDTRKRELRRIAEKAVMARWFDGIEDAARVAELLVGAYPLTAAALQALPRTAARVGQNERSLLTFIEESKLESIIGTSEIYSTFSEAMRADVGLGGMHRRWLETENALSRADNDAEREALTAACLLQLGTDGERRRLGRRALELAVASRGGRVRAAAQTVEALLSRKLLIHRRTNDDISIWHGTDVDMASRIRDERNHRAEGFDPVEFLQENHPAPFVRPSRHNAERGTTRYLTGHYVSAKSILQTKGRGAMLPGAREWGRVYYVLAESAEDLNAAHKHIKKLRSGVEAPVVFAIANEPVPATDAGLEVAALTALQCDEALLSEDPLISQEIDELLSIAHRQLVLVLHRLITDRPADTTWMHGGKALGVTPDRPAGIAASELMDDWYPQTPKIRNDQMMRNRLSRQMQTAQVRVILRIMEHGHEERLGYVPDDTSAEASVYRTVLERTGIHRSIEEHGQFAEPDELNDPGLRAAWEQIGRFFREPQPLPKPLSEIVDVLRSRPIGLPLGVVPILVMAGYRAFARTVSLRTDCAYVPDVLGFETSRMFAEPERHTVTVYEASDATTAYLREVAYVFAHVKPRADQELVRFACDALAQWMGSVPQGGRRTRRLSRDAQRLMKLIHGHADPASLIVADLPVAFGQGRNGQAYEKTIRTLQRVRDEMDGLVEGYMEVAGEMIATTLCVDNEGDPLERVQSWIRCLDVENLLARSDLRITDKAVLRTARDTLNGRYSPQSLSRSLSSILLQCGIEQWQDTTVDQFRLLLRECRQRIEDTALAAEESHECMAPLVRARIAALEGMLERMERGKSLERTERAKEAGHG